MEPFRFIVTNKDSIGIMEADLKNPANYAMRIHTMINYNRIHLKGLLNPIRPGGDSTTISELAKFRLILLNKRVPRLCDF